MGNTKKPPNSRSSSSSSHEDPTRVDLGDDLIEATAIRPRPGSTGEAGADELLERATFMINEGFIDDAKALLRQILIRAPHEYKARKALEEIHAKELKGLVGGGTSGGQRSRSATGADESSTSEGGGPDEVLRRLDEELQLGIGDEERNPVGAVVQEQLRELEARVENAIPYATPADARLRMDLGIGFLEMGFHDLASRQFSTAFRIWQESADNDGPDGAEAARYAISATGLLAYALILGGRALEASQKLQEALRDHTLSGDARTELHYLLGRAFEGLGQVPQAIVWYRKALETEPQYRDAEARWRALARSAGKNKGGNDPS